MNNLQKQVKTHAIITFTGGHYFITNQQNEILKQLNLSGNINLGEAIIHCRNIAEIMSIEKYYETYPEKKLTQNYKDFTGLCETTRGFSEERRKRALQNIILGFKKFKDGEMIENAKQMLFKMEIKLKNK